MRRGRPLKPIITIDSVTAALKSLDYSRQTQSETQPLENLLLIDFRLQKSARPSAEDIRAWMLRKILVDFMTNALNRNRQHFSLQAASLNNSREIVIRQLQQDFQTDSEHLKGWSLLFLRYVRPELTFSMQELSDQTHSHKRSLQRYQDTAIHRLRDMLIEAEWQVRNTQQQSYLKSRIPEQIVQLFGRNREIEAVLSHFQEDFLKPVVISGVNGIGKSALAAYLTNYLIGQQAIDYLLWLDNPSDVSLIANKIWDTILPYPSQQHWREILDYQRLLLVIDGLNNIDVNSDEWAELLVNLKSAFVLIINIEKPILTQFVHHLELEKLSQVDSEKLIRTYLPQAQILVLNTQQIIEAVGGNPRAMIHAMQFQETSDNNLSINQFFDMRFDNLSHHDRVLQVLSTASHQNIEFIREIFQIAAEDNKQSASTKFSIVDIQTRYATDSELRSQTRQMLQRLLKEKLKRDMFDVFLLNVASCEWLKLSKDFLQKILVEIDLTNLSVGDVRQWRYVYLRHFGIDSIPNMGNLGISYQYGIALRRLHAHQEATHYLQGFIQFLGQEGQFELQFRAFYELGLLFQSQAEFTKAIDIYVHIQALDQSYSVPKLFNKVSMQLARIAIEQQDAKGALGYLEDLDLEQPDIFVLFCEARLLLDDASFLIASIPAYLTHHKLANNIRASLHTILGRAYEHDENYEESIIQLNEAVSITEREANQFDIARARNNLGSCYLMTLKKQSEIMLNELETLFHETQHLQSQIKDAVGVEASTRNLNYLQHHRAKQER